MSVAGGRERLRKSGGREASKDKEVNNEGGDGGDRIVEDDEISLILPYEAFGVFLDTDGVLASGCWYSSSS